MKIGEWLTGCVNGWMNAFFEMAAPGLFPIPQRECWSPGNEGYARHNCALIPRNPTDEGIRKEVTNRFEANCVGTI